jgi:general secretion pathway protein A
MYESFFGLKIKPFQLNPDPNFWYAAKPHKRAKAYLDYGVSRHEGFIVITGEVGAGKTTVLAELLANLDRAEVVVGQIVTTQLDADDTLRMVAAAYGLPVKNLPKAELLIALEAFLVTQASRGKRCLLIVDEAQNLTPRAVEELRMLSNYQLGTQSLLQSFLVGQPEFRQILQKPDMEQFRQRIAASCHLGPLDEEDVRGYITHRMVRAGCSGALPFEENCFAAIHAATSGIPRRINALADRLLLLGFLEGRQTITEGDVRAVAAELADESGGVRPLDEAGPVATPFATQIRPAGEQVDDDRLLRMERSLLRIERVQMQTLAMLRELIDEFGHRVEGESGQGAAE